VAARRRHGEKKNRKQQWHEATPEAWPVVTTLVAVGGANGVMAISVAAK